MTETPASAFDPETYKLAEYFIPDAAPENHRRELAQLIQDTLESWLQGHGY